MLTEPPYPTADCPSPADGMPFRFLVSPPARAAVAGLDGFLRTQSVELSEDTLAGCAAAVLVGFAFAGGLEDDQIEQLRQIVARAATTDAESGPR